LATSATAVMLSVLWNPTTGMFTYRTVFDTLSEKIVVTLAVSATAFP
jgi:hypothetical protein